MERLVQTAKVPVVQKVVYVHFPPDLEPYNSFLFGNTLCFIKVFKVCFFFIYWEEKEGQREKETLIGCLP